MVKFSGPGRSTSGGRGGSYRSSVGRGGSYSATPAKRPAGGNYRPGTLNSYMGRGKPPGGGGRSLPTRPGSPGRAIGAVRGARAGARAGGRIGATTSAMRKARPAR